MRVRFAVVAPLVLLVACSGRDAGRAGGAAVWQVDSVAALEIGQAEGDSVYQLFRVRDIVELADGGSALVNNGTQQIRLYDSQGRFVRAFGRQGEGPGEFKLLLNLSRRGDTLYAYDRMLGRLTRFLQTGEYVGDVALRTSANMMTPTFAGLLQDGSAAGWISKLPDELADGFQRSVALLVRVTPGQQPDTLDGFPGLEGNIRTARPSAGNMVMAITLAPFNRSFLAAAADNRIYAAPTDSAVIYVWDGAGAPLDTLRWVEQPRPVDDALVAAVADRETANLDAADAAQRRRSLLEDPRPATAPVFDKLVLGPDGEVWVRRFDDPRTAASEWLVFGEDGELRARVRMPHQQEIRAVGRERVYTLERDERDVEYVRAYQLRR